MLSLFPADSFNFAKKSLLLVSQRPPTLPRRPNKQLASSLSTAMYSYQQSTKTPASRSSDIHRHLYFQTGGEYLKLRVRSLSKMLSYLNPSEQCHCFRSSAPSLADCAPQLRYFVARSDQLIRLFSQGPSIASAASWEM